MRLSLILEAKLDLAWLNKTLPGQKDAIDSIIKADPTGGEYYKWLVKIYNTDPTIFDDTNTISKIHDDLEFFVVRKQIARQLDLSADLNTMNYKQFNDLIDKMRYHVAAQQSKTPGSGVSHLSKHYPGVEILHNGGGYILFKCPRGNDQQAVESLQQLGIGTEWCTRLGATPSLATTYLNRSNIYTLYKDGRPLYQFHVATPNTDIRQCYEFKNAKNATPDKADIDIGAINILSKHDEPRCCLILLGVIEADEQFITKLILDRNYTTLGAIAISHRKRWPDGKTRQAVEAFLLRPEFKGDDDDDNRLTFAIEYAITAHIRDEDLEFTLLESLNPRTDVPAVLMSNYIAAFIKGQRWPEAESYLLRFPELMMQYMTAAFNPSYNDELEELFVESYNMTRSRFTANKWRQMIIEYCLNLKHSKWSAFNDLILTDETKREIARYKQDTKVTTTGSTYGLSPALLAAYYDLPDEHDYFDEANWAQPNLS